MAKKFGKFVLFATAATAAAATAYYFMQKKDAILLGENDDEDYDDFSESLEDTDTASRTYVPLNRDGVSETGAASVEDDFTPLTETVEAVKNKAEETVEEFFDEADPAEEEAPISDDE